MNIQLSGKNIELTEALKQYVDTKIGGLAKFNESITEIRVTLEDVREQHKEEFKATAQFHVGHEVLFTEEVAATMYAAIDIVKDEMERQLRDLKNKLETKHRRANAESRDRKSAV
ncbi:MAG: ribosome-associated translation inhibitor RaiA [Patescibacteria group bacterium]|jgi:putative sigma-54 modulation protein